MKEKIKTFYKKNQIVIDYGIVLGADVVAILTIGYLTKYIKGQKITAVADRTIDGVHQIGIFFKNGTEELWEFELPK